jgi:hypothetical protein
MKKMILSIAALAMIFGVTLITSCSKDDTTAPVITLVGSSTVTVTLGSSYTDAGATANDNKDGDLTSSIVSTYAATSNPNTNLVGTYTITYTVSDAAGNTGTATRTVNVVNSAAFLAGTYNVTDIGTGDSTGTWTYAVTVTASSTVNNNISIANFGGFGSSVMIAATYTASNSTLNIASQIPSALAVTVQGTGITNTTSILSTNTSTDFGGGAAENDNCSYVRGSKK